MRNALLHVVGLCTQGPMSVLAYRVYCDICGFLHNAKTMINTCCSLWQDPALGTFQCMHGPMMRAVACHFGLNYSCLFTDSVHHVMLQLGAQCKWKYSKNLHRSGQLQQFIFFLRRVVKPPATPSLG